jgi:hypothetical protein
MSDEDLRICFAMFAMLKMSWHRGDEDMDAKDCWFIADKMLEARNAETSADEGIVAIKKRKYTRKGEA